jgi:hypothetical protein
VNVGLEVARRARFGGERGTQRPIATQRSRHAGVSQPKRHNDPAQAQAPRTHCDTTVATRGCVSTKATQRPRTGPSTPNPSRHNGRDTPARLNQSDTNTQHKPSPDSTREATPTLRRCASSTPLCARYFGPHPGAIGRKQPLRTQPPRTHCDTTDATHRRASTKATQTPNTAQPRLHTRGHSNSQTLCVLHATLRPKISGAKPRSGRILALSDANSR